MKKAALLTVFMFAGLAFGQAEIKFKEMIHDFGDIERGQKVSHNFEFTNTGNQPLEILNVGTSCGCTSAKPEKTVYAPGEGGMIPVTFDSARFTGPQTKRVTVTTNNQEKTVVTIKANIIVDVNVKPTSVFFANAPMNKTTTQKVLVNTEKLANLNISDLEVKIDAVDVKVNKVDDKTAEIEITADGAKFPNDKSRFSGFIKFKTNSKTSPDVRLPVTVHVKRPLKASPNSVYFFATKKGQKREAIVRVSSNEAKDFKILDMKSDIPGINIEMEKDDGKIKQIKVSLADTAKEGKFSGVITLITDIPDQKELRLNLRGSVLP